MLVLTGLTQNTGRELGDGAGDHARAASTFLTGVHPKKTAGADIHVGISADQVAAKMDVSTWFGSLSHRMKQIAKDMAFGSSTKELAEKHGVTASRISQMRRSLEKSWAEFQGEVAPALA